MSQVDPAGELAKLLDAAIGRGLAGASVAWPAKVLVFDGASGTASIQPLLQLNDRAPAPIQRVPVIGQRARTQEGATLILLPDLRPGDTVYVVCADRQMGQAASGQPVKPESERSHSRNDAVIVGVFPCCLQS
jgi:hypothetical protein